MGKNKEKKRAELEAEPQTTSQNYEPENELDLSTNKKKKKKKKDVSNELTIVSVAVPGSIIDNAQSLELATRVLRLCGNNTGRNETITFFYRRVCYPHLMLHIICTNTGGHRSGKNVLIDQVLKPGVRVTVALGTNCNLDAGGYDHLIGTSEHGDTVNSSELILPNFRHLLIALGGLAGLEESIEEDDNLKLQLG